MLKVWKGPDAVFGLDGQFVLVHLRRAYPRVPPRQFMKVKKECGIRIGIREKAREVQVTTSRNLEEVSDDNDPDPQIILKSPTNGEEANNA